MSENPPPRRSVLQDWVMDLGLRHQGVLLSASRGCDSVPKEDPSKKLVRVLRGACFNSYDPRPSSYIERVGFDELASRMSAFLGSCDHHPQHFVAHLMHAAEIVGYHHPDGPTREIWRRFYEAICDGLHVNPETEEQLEDRLRAGESEFAARSSKSVAVGPAFLEGVDP